MSIDLPIYDVNDVERIIVIKNWTRIPGLKGETRRAPEDCYPSEPDVFEDIECVWKDTMCGLTAEEYDAYAEDIDKAIFEHVCEEAEAAKDEAADRYYHRHMARSGQTTPDQKRNELSR